MANVTQLKHLEHLEDEMLNYGVDALSKKFLSISRCLIFVPLCKCT